MLVKIKNERELKMKKIILLFMILVLSLSLASCRKKISLNDTIEKDEIKTLSIIKDYSSYMLVVEQKKLVNPIVKVLNVPYVEMMDGERASEEIDVWFIITNTILEKHCNFSIYPNGKIVLWVTNDSESKAYMSTEKINLDKINKLIYNAYRENK